VIAFISRWLKSGKIHRQTRLSNDEALIIARNAAPYDPLSADLGVTTVENRSGHLTWLVSSATVGLALEVTIDDASGNVLEVRRTGIR
jgi:hypothetical protein